MANNGNFIKRLVFARRQPIALSCRHIYLHTTFGTCEAEYVNTSERNQSDGNWSYEFFVQDADAPGGLNSETLNESVMIEPFITAVVKTNCCPP